jgi:hypothetical protein
LATSSVPRSDDLAEPLRRTPRVSWRGIVAVLALFAVTLVAARACQEEEIRISSDRAVDIARPQAGFVPDRTQVRLVRQGLKGQAFWAISFSADGRITTVRVDADNGRVAAVNRER